VLGLPKEREPGWTTATADGAIVRCQHPPDHILVGLDPKGFGQLLRNSRTAKARVALLQFHDGADQFGSRSGVDLACA